MIVFIQVQIIHLGIRYIISSMHKFPILLYRKVLQLKLWIIKMLFNHN